MNTRELSYEDMTDDQIFDAHIEEKLEEIKLLRKLDSDELNEYRQELAKYERSQKLAPWIAFPIGIALYFVHPLTGIVWGLVVYWLVVGPKPSRPWTNSESISRVKREIEMLRIEKRLEDLEEVA